MSRFLSQSFKSVEEKETFGNSVLFPLKPFITFSQIFTSEVGRGNFITNLYWGKFILRQIYTEFIRSLRFQQLNNKHIKCCFFANFEYHLFDEITLKIVILCLHCNAFEVFHRMWVIGMVPQSFNAIINNKWHTIWNIRREVIHFIPLSLFCSAHTQSYERWKKNEFTF